METYKDNYLMHYGVPGMKWGHRKQRRLAKSLRKGDWKTSRKTIKNEVSNSKKYSNLHKTRQAIKEKYGNRRVPANSKELIAFQSELKNVANQLLGKYGKEKTGNTYIPTLSRKAERNIDSVMADLYHDITVYGKYHNY